MKHLIILLPFFFFSFFANGQDSESPTQKDTALRSTLRDSSVIVQNQCFQIRNFIKDTTTLLADSIKDIPNINNNSGNISFVCSRVDAYVYYLDGVRVEEADCFVSVNIQPPLLKPLYNKRVFPREKLRILAVRNINEIANLTAGVQLTTNGLSFRGSREDGTSYYLDGMRLLEDPFLIESF